MKKVFTLFLMLFGSMAFAQVSTWDGTWEPWTHGTGTESDPFLIENAQQLAYLAFRVNNGFDAGGGHVSNHDYHYKLTVDVDLNGSENFQWTPIGYWNSDTDYQCFGGSFNGILHTVSGIYINGSANRVGLFGYTDGATVKKLTLYGTMIATSGAYAGGIIGVANNETVISDCSSYFTCGVSCTSNAGGIVGRFEVYSSRKTITNCNNNSDVQGAYVGGIVGLNAGITAIRNCYNTGNVSGNQSGGILGYEAHPNAYNDSTIIANCYNTGSVTSVNYCGGIMGYNTYSYGNNNCTIITNCYNRGTMTGNNSGGILGYDYFYYGSNNSTIITNCYNTGNSIGGVVGYANSAGSGNLILTINNSYYVSSFGGNNTYGGLSMSTDAMQTTDFVTIINAGSSTFVKDIQPCVNNGFPVFDGWLYVKTNQATNIQKHEATLNGIHSTNNNIVSKGFVYKKKSNQNFTTINCSEEGNSYSDILSGLESGTEYQYRAFVTTSNGSVYGAMEEFVTLVPQTFVITAVASDHGTISPGGEIMVHEGHNKTFTITPDPGFEIAALIVDNDTVEIASTYTFANVTQNHTIRASFVELTGPCLPPINLVVNDVNATSARLSWQGGADAYAIAYGMDGNYNHTAVTMGNNITIEGLLSQANYVWKIKSLCGELETDYVEGQPFTTSGHGVNEGSSVVFSMWPNPTRGTLYITGDSIKKIEIVNMLGQSVISVDGNAIPLDVSRMGAGLYLVKVTDDNGLIGIGKMMVE